jgi:hypothetical protein
VPVRGGKKNGNRWLGVIMGWMKFQSDNHQLAGEPVQLSQPSSAFADAPQDMEGRPFFFIWLVRAGFVNRSQT